MNELELMEINNSISYEEGKIYWKDNKGYSNKVFDNLKENGYCMRKIGASHILFDRNKNKVCYEFTRIGLLVEISKIFR